MQILVEEKGMMPVKKSGVKLHIGVDILGLPHMLLITSANIKDRNGAIEMLSYYSAKSDRLIRLQKILVDGGCSGENLLILYGLYAVQKLKWQKETNYTNLLLSKNDG